MGWIEYWCSYLCRNTRAMAQVALCVWLGHTQIPNPARITALTGRSVGHTIIDTFWAHGKGLWSNRQKE